MNEADQDQLTDLMLRYLDGDTTAEENATLRARLRDDVEAQRLFARAMRLSGNLATALLETETQAATTAAGVGEVGELARRARRRPRPLAAFAAGAAAAAAVAVAVWMASRPDAPRGVADGEPRSGGEAARAERESKTGEPTPAIARAARLTTATGKVFRLRDAALSPVGAGDVIAAGEGLTTEQGSADLQLPAGGTVRVGPASTMAQLHLGAGGDSLFLSQGSAEVTIPATAGSTLRMATARLEVTLMAARVRVTAAPTSARVDVLEGKARVVERRSERAHDVETGQFAITTDDRAVEIARTPESGGILFVMGEAARSADRIVQRRLARFGRPVRVVEDHALAELSTAPLPYDLIVISSTVRSGSIDERLRATAVPIVTWESWLFDALGMTGSNEDGLAGFISGDGDVLIKSTGHALAAGLTGRVRVTSLAGPTAFGVPSPTAVWVATVPGEPTRAALFAYRRGDVLVDGQPAPAARVGLFLRDSAPPIVTDDGWALFDAAITWALSSRAP